MFLGIFAVGALFIFCKVVEQLYNFFEILVIFPILRMKGYICTKGYYPYKYNAKTRVRKDTGETEVTPYRLYQIILKIREAEDRIDKKSESEK